MPTSMPMEGSGLKGTSDIAPHIGVCTNFGTYFCR